VYPKLLVAIFCEDFDDLAEIVFPEQLAKKEPVRIVIRREIFIGSTGWIINILNIAKSGSIYMLYSYQSIRLNINHSFPDYLLQICSGHPTDHSGPYAYSGNPVS